MMSTSTTNVLTTNAKGTLFILLALALGAMGVLVARTATEPGGVVIAMLLMTGAVRLGIGAVRHRLPTRAVRTALAVGILIAAGVAVLMYDVAEPLFAQPQDVPSAVGPGPSAGHAAAVARAREVARAAMLEQNLPGVSIAVGMDGDVVWAEGLGWRDVGTQTPVTPRTRFNIGTAASALTAATGAVPGLTGTGTDAPATWSPEHVGEPEEDFPIFTLIRKGIFQPLGLAASEYPLPGDRATFYVPRADDLDPRRGRRLMYLRDLACCAGHRAFSSTPSDLVRFAQATNADSLDGELAGGRVMSLVTRRDMGIVVVVASNIAHADTAALARNVADVFARQP
ncbi:MAG: serine hydrolase [Vicinamibacterales bacterium]